MAYSNNWCQNAYIPKLSKGCLGTNRINYRLFNDCTRTCKRGLRAMVLRRCFRHYAILHPMRAKFSCTIDRTKKVILLIWSMSFVFALPIIFGQVIRL